MRHYYTYIITNYKKTVLYTGITNNLESGLIEHYHERGNKKKFTGRYQCFYLLYYEDYSSPSAAIAREKEIKGWVRRKKEELINSSNPDWDFLNEEITPWPPEPGVGKRY